MKKENIIACVLGFLLAGCAVKRSDWLEQARKPLNNGSVVWWEKVKRSD